MKTPFRRLMLVFAITVLAVLTAFPLFAAPAPGVEFAVLELTQSPDCALNITKAMDANIPLELAVLCVNLDADDYVIMKNNAALQNALTEDAPNFILADNQKTTATLRHVLTIKTENGSYALMAVSQAMNTEVPLPPTVLAHGNTKTGGSIYQVNNEFDRYAATLDQQPDGAWVITR